MRWENKGVKCPSNEESILAQIDRLSEEGWEPWWMQECELLPAIPPTTLNEKTGLQELNPDRRPTVYGTLILFKRPVEQIRSLAEEFAEQESQS